MTRRLVLFIVLWAPLAVPARGELRSESWGGGGKLTHPRTLRVVTTGKMPRVIFDLSAIPLGAKVHRASLSVRCGQPREPIEIYPIARLDEIGNPVSAGKPLELEPPYFRSFDVTAAVRTWVGEPKANLGLAAARFPGDLAQARLWVFYEADVEEPKPPPQVEGLGVIHRHGQTFLRWKELPVYRPPAEKVLWVEHVGRQMPTAKGPGPGSAGHPRPAGITLQTLRDLQGLAVRDKPVGHWARQMPPFKRLREVPEVSYRIYRHSEPITAGNLHAAKVVGEVKALSIYQQSFMRIKSHGEYYGPHEDAESVLPTWSVGEGEPVLPGQSYFVYTPAADGKAYYAVTAVRDGTENVADLSAANCSPAVSEKVAEPQPVLQWVATNKTRYGNSTATEYWYAYWLAPPYANVPDNRPRRVVMGVPKDFAEPGPLVVGTHAGMGPGWKVDNIDKAYLHVEQDVAYGGDLCYHSGRGTLLSFRRGRVDYYSERYVTKMIRWVLGKWKIDRSRIIASVGSHYGIRHPELFPMMWMAPYAVDYNQKWNPSRGSLDGRLGPRDLAKTVDGNPAWDVFDINWYLRQDPGKDIPFWVHDVSGKESGHNVEYGWQDDAQGLSALRDTRQPHVARWGGRISGEIINGLRKMKWTKSVPAFTNCSLDANPGNGDPADGDPWGQINGWLFWEFDTVVDEKDKWAMTVYLTADCPDPACTVDLTPRHCRKFQAEPGAAFAWTNASVAGGENVDSGEVRADKWGRVTLRQITVTKGRNRITIARQE